MDMIQMLTVAANIAQVLGTLWMLLVGGKSLFEVIKDVFSHLHLPPINFPKFVCFLIIVLLITVVIASLPYIFPFPVKYPVQIQATTTARASIQATASEIQTYYNKIISEKPSWNDLLDGSSNANGWDIFNANHGAEQCGFSEGAYHAYARQDKVVGECFARVPTFNNFIYRVQMYVVEGDSGGIIFRSKTPNYNSVMYRFHLSVLNNGSYDVYRSYNNNQGDNFACGGIQVDYCPSTTIIAGVHETNYLSVMAKGSKMYFFVNNLLIFWITDSTSSTGYIGLFANDKPDTTDVQFNNAEVWKL